MYTGTFAIMTGTYCVGFMLLYPLRIMIFDRPQHLIATIAADFRQNYLTRERLLPAALILFIIPVFISAFTLFKGLIPVIHPFSWDPAFVELDRLLHGGIDPWRLIHPVVGIPIVTTVINAFYHLWYFIFYGVLFWQAFSVSNPNLRMRFLISFVATWAILGSLVALCLSSAGPVYYGRITGLDDPYRELMDYLVASSAQFPVWALEIQGMLWESYENGNSGFGSGISAMPSVHVGLSVLLALTAWQANRVIGILLTIFALMIQIGSVHLGWHYAVDGYLAAALVWLIWTAVGWLVERTSDSEFEPLPQPI